MSSATGPKVKVTELTPELIKFVLYDCDLSYSSQVVEPARMMRGV